MIHGIGRISYSRVLIPSPRIIDEMPHEKRHIMKRLRVIDLEAYELVHNMGFGLEPFFRNPKVFKQLQKFSLELSSIQGDANLLFVHYGRNWWIPTIINKVEELGKDRPDTVPNIYFKDWVTSGPESVAIYYKLIDSGRDQ